MAPPGDTGATLANEQLGQRVRSWRFPLNGSAERGGRRRRNLAAFYQREVCATCRPPTRFVRMAARPPTAAPQSWRSPGTPTKSREGSVWN